MSKVSKEVSKEVSIAAFESRVTAVVQGSAEDMATLVKFEISTPQQFEIAAMQRATLKAEYEAIDAERDALVRPKNDWVKIVNSKAKPALDFLTAAIKLLSNSMSSYQIREEARQQKALEEVQAKSVAGDVEGATAAIAKLESQVPSIAGLSKASEKWIVVSVDQSKLPPHLLMPDMKKIEALVKASKIENPLPGVIARAEKVFVQRKVG